MSNEVSPALITERHTARDIFANRGLHRVRIIEFATLYANPFVPTMKPRLTTLLIFVWSFVLLAVANVGVAGDFDYTAPSGTPDADFSTEYTYDILSRLTSIKRHGVVDIEGDTEVFGMLDDITLTYSGAVLARMQSNITEETGRNFYGRTGWAEGTFMPSATVSYNAAGRLCADGSRMLGAVSYNTNDLEEPITYQDRENYKNEVEYFIALDPIIVTLPTTN